MANLRPIAGAALWNVPVYSFDLYGVTFRWIAESTTYQGDKTTVSLVREHGKFPVDHVSWLTRGDMGAPWFGVIGDYYAYRFDSVGDFLLLRDGSMLRAFIWPEADPWLLSFVLFRGIIPRLLHLRGVPCLHASAICVGQGVVGFLGPSGCGKSTLAAALVARGFPLVSDDILPLRSGPGGQGTIAGPGLPELRLYSSAAELAGVVQHLSPPGQGQTKGRWNPNSAQVTHNAAPLTQLYLLQPYQRGPENDPGARRGPPLTQVQAFMALVENSFWLHPDETRALASDMICFAQVVRSVPICLLPFEPALESFAAVERLIRLTSSDPAKSGLSKGENV